MHIKIKHLHLLLHEYITTQVAKGQCKSMLTTLEFADATLQKETELGFTAGPN